MLRAHQSRVCLLVLIEVRSFQIEYHMVGLQSCLEALSIRDSDNIPTCQRPRLRFTPLGGL